MHRLKPKSIKELAACLALVRGPCISSKMDERYMKIIEGKEEIELIHPIYDKVCKSTHGVLLYQEQLMKICNNIGFSLEEGYKIMKHSSKKHFDELKAYEEQFMKLAKKIKMDNLVAERIFKMIVDSGLYSFNESHAIAYAITCYISAYFKYYYPKEFLVASLTNAYERKEKVEDLVQECRRLGFTFVEPNINNSDWDFTMLDDNKIQIGICAIKSFGYKAFEEISKKRPFTSMDDFLERITKKDCSRKSIIPAIFVGCFNDFYEDRISAYYDYCKICKSELIEEVVVQGEKERININETNDIFEKAFLQNALISNPLNQLPVIDIENKKGNFNIIGLFNRIKKIKDKNENKMAFLTLSTGNGDIECILFATNYKEYNSFLKKNLICKLNLKKGRDNYIVNSIEQTAI